MLPHNPKREGYWRSGLKEPPYVLDCRTRKITLQAIMEICRYRDWIAYAIHARTTHVHAVIAGEAKPERMLSDFKAYATGALRSAATTPERCGHWTDHGSTHYLWNQSPAIEYVLNGQGIRMAYHWIENESGVHF